MLAGALEIQLSADVARLRKDMTDAKNTVDGAMTSISNAAATATKILGALGIGVGLVGLGRLAKEAISAQDELAKMSQRVGVSVERLAGLEHAASLSGASLEAVQKALKGTSTQLLDADRGLKASIDNFRDLGINIHDTNGALKSADAVMVEVADQFAAMEDGTNKTALATKLFGKAGLDLIPMLNEGSAGLAELIAEGQKYNPVTAESAKQAEMFNDNLERAQKSVGMLGVELTNNLLPSLAAFSEEMVEYLNSDEFDEHLELTTDAVKLLATMLGVRLVASLVLTSAGFIANTAQSIAYQAALARMAGTSTGAAIAQTGLATATLAANRALSLVGGPIGGILIAAAAVYKLTEYMIELRAETYRLSGDAFAKQQLDVIGISAEQAGININAAKEAIAVLNLELTSAQEIYGENSTEVENLNSSLDRQYNWLNLNKIALSEAAAAANTAGAASGELSEKAAEYIESLKTQIERVGMTERAVYLLEAADKAGAEASAAQREEAVLLAGALFDKQAAFDATAQAQKDADDLAAKHLQNQIDTNKSLDDQIAALEQQQEALQMTARAALIYNTLMSAGADAAPEKVALLIQETVNLWDQEQAILAKAEALKLAGAATEEFDRETQKAADQLADFLDPTRPQTFGEALRGAFDGAGDALVKLATSLDAYGIKQAEIDQARRNAVRAYGKDSKEYAAANIKITKEEAKTRLGAYGDMAGAASQFFDEQSKGYQGLQVASQIYHAAELAMQLKEMVPKAVNAVLNQGNGDPYSAFARMAAMAAIVGGLGVAIGGGGSSEPSITKDAFSAQEANEGAGSILGDAKAQSESIMNSLSALEDMAKPELTYTSQMVDLLKSINNSLAGATKSILSSGFDLAGTSFDGKTTQSGGGIWGAIFGSSSSTTTLADLGLAFAKQTISEAMTAVQLQGYQVTQKDWKKSGFLGIGSKSGTDYSTSFSSIDGAVSESMTGVLRQMVEAVTVTGQQLGATAEQIAAIQGMDTGLGKVSLKDKTGEEVQEVLSAIFSALGDNMAKTVLPSLTKYQEIGEGSLETLTRVASTNEYVMKTFDKLGLSLDLTGLAAIDATMSITDAMGGLSEMSRAIDEYYENFYTEAEQQSNLIASLTTQFEALGLSLPDSREGFRALVDAQDRSTEAGRELFAALIKMSGAFAEAVDATEELSVAEDKLVQARIGSVEALTSEMEAALNMQRSIQSSIYSVMGISSIGGADGSTAGQIAAISQRRDALIKQHSEQMRAEQDLHDSRVRSAQTLIAAAQQLRIGSESALSGIEQMNEARRQYDSLLAAAQGGDAGAAQGLGAAAQSYLALAKNQATDEVSFRRDFARITGQLENTASMIAPSGPFDPSAANAELIAQLQLLDDELSMISLGVNENIIAELKNINVTLSDLSPNLQESLIGAIGQWVQVASPDGQGIIDALSGIRASVDILPPEIADYLSDTMGQFLSAGGFMQRTVEGLAPGSLPRSAGENYLTGQGFNLEYSSDEVVKRIGELRDQIANDVDFYRAVALEATAGGVSALQLADNVGISEASVLQAASSAGVNLSYSAKQISDRVKQIQSESSSDTEYFRRVAEEAIAGGVSSAQLAVALGYTQAEILAAAASVGIPAFARGGDHKGGLRLVGENGPELEATGPSRIFNAQQTSRMMGGDDSAIEIKELRKEVANLNYALLQIAKNTGKSSKQLERWDYDGMPTERDEVA